MTHDDRFDQAMRERHAQALARITPATRLRLRVARTAATPVRGFGWALASGFAALFAVAIALQLYTPRPPAPDTAIASGDAVRPEPASEPVAMLDENPDLYLWLASNADAVPTALE